MIRPGPPAIEPGVCPGGIVFHVYGVPDHDLLLVSPVGPDDDIEAVATADALMVELRGTGRARCMVIYDGDSGERLLPPGHVTGDRL